MGSFDSTARVTVLIAHHRCVELLSAALTSVVGQTEKAWEMLIVDDRSVTLDEWAELSRRWPDPRIRWLQTSDNVGQFRIYNRLLPAVSTDYLMLHDADDTSVPHRLETQLAALEDRGLDIVGSAVIRVDEAGSPIRSQSPHVDVNRALKVLRRGNSFIGPTMLARTEFLRRMGGFDGTLRIGGDTELICRAVFAGRVSNLADLLYHQTVRLPSLTQSLATGFGSPARERVARRINQRFYANQWRRLSGRLTAVDLVAPANDVEFTLHDLAGRPWPG